MNRKEALEMVKPHLTEHRYTHTLGVRDTALTLAEKMGADQDKAEIAAIFHDYAKFRSKDEMRGIIKEQQLDEDFIHYGDELLHAPAGAHLVKKEIGIADEEILSSIFWHTTGRPEMSNMEKVIFLADYIEPNRKFPGVEQVRETAEKDMDEAIRNALSNTVTFLLQKNQPVFPGTLKAYNDITFKKQKNKGGK
ncbi:bis(5'-nucleosyl)-tetraphosphatase (symmetrical) YqeK [Salibacterium halotolerans]|uniref:bis(5'-nucleosyl)-tetraphosphatase (symmetrical) n=1 Tax=Salibacterium halotolerans TaxID=1884432 RepID=A0A1I5NDY5_9BACI|nr:bis(5'-nucleosyl)-tetraphosphatase (symmetrical) YqeK [Salibacterium halotolerans]SFP19993.1 putative HD superfamily hydrolase of NAD metabolism [Salibacterium halotolerans]